MPATAVLFAVAMSVVLSVLALLIFSLWGLPVVAAILVVLVAYVVAARKRGGSAATIERGKHPEPTGRPRKGSGGTTTTNQRVGG